MTFHLEKSSNKLLILLLLTEWGLIEDGGEMLVMSTIVSYVFNLRVIPRSKSYSNARSKVRGV